MLYYQPPNQDPTDPNLVFWAAWWLLRRDKTVFGRSDCVDFSHWALKRGVVGHPPDNVSELVEWCKVHLVGLMVKRTDGPDPFLKN